MLKKPNTIISDLTVGIETEYSSVFSCDPETEVEFIILILDQIRRQNLHLRRSEFLNWGDKCYADMGKYEHATLEANTAFIDDGNLGKFLTRQVLIGDRLLYLAADTTAEHLGKLGTKVQWFVGTDVSDGRNSWGYHINIGVPKANFGIVNEKNPKAIVMANVVASSVVWAGSGGLYFDKDNLYKLSCAQKSRFVSQLMSNYSVTEKPIICMRSQESHGDNEKYDRIHITSLDRPSTPFILEHQVNFLTAVALALCNNIHFPQFKNAIDVCTELGLSSDTTNNYRLADQRLMSPAEYQVQIASIIQDQSKFLELPDTIKNSVDVVKDLCEQIINGNPPVQLEWVMRQSYMEKAIGLQANGSNQPEDPNNAIYYHRYWSQLNKGAAPQLLRKSQNLGHGSLGYEEYCRIMSMGWQDYKELEPQTPRAITRQAFSKALGLASNYPNTLTIDWSGARLTIYGSAGNTVQYQFDWPDPKKLYDIELPDPQE